MPARCRRPNVAVVAGGGILLGHGVAPRGAWYNDRLEGSVVCAVVYFSFRSVTNTMYKYKIIPKPT